MNATGLYFLRYIDGLLYQRGIVQAHEQGRVSVQVARADGAYNHRYMVQEGDIDDSWMMYSTLDGLNKAVRESEFGDIWMPIGANEFPADIEAGLATLNEHVPPQ
jgi:hypothetical protein